MAAVTRDDVDEVKVFQDLHAIGAAYAAWRIFKFTSFYCKPSVLALPVHLENGQRMMMNEEEIEYQEHRIASNVQLDISPPATPLTSWFKYNILALSNDSPMYRYVDMVEHCTFQKGASKKWKDRIANIRVIGRVHSVHPSKGDIFYLRMLLHDIRSVGATSFRSLRTYNTILHRNYKDACLHLGLLQDDNEWHECLTEAANYSMPWALRQLFCFIICENDPSDVERLFETHYSDMIDDFERNLRLAGKIEASENILLLRTMVLLAIDD